MMGTLKELGGTICVITPQQAEARRPLIEKHKIAFDLLSDHRNEYAAKLGLRFKLPDDLKKVYLSFGNDLAVRNGKDSWTLPMPGRLVIRSEEHTSELQSHLNLVCRLLLEKKKYIIK